MSQPEKVTPATIISKVIAVGKDLVALLRDSTIFILTVLLIVFPAKFNSILVAAGFEEGSFVGLKWKSNLEVTNESLEMANQKIDELQANNDELVEALESAKKKLNEVDSSGSELKEKIAQLEQSNIQQKSETQKFQSTVSQRLQQNISIIQNTKSIAIAGKSSYFVGLQTLGVSDRKRLSINDKIRDEGYSLYYVSYAYAKEEKPSWFAARSTVFYYADSVKEQAKELAKDLKKITGKSFVIQRGAGKGVDRDKRNITFYVHYIES